MSVGVLAVICWNNPWSNPRLRLGSSVALCTPQTSHLKQMTVWKIIQRLGQEMLCQRRALSAELLCIPGNWKPVILRFRESCGNISHTERLQFSSGWRMTWDLNSHNLAIAPLWYNQGLKERLVQQYIFLLHYSIEEDAVPASFRFLSTSPCKGRACPSLAACFAAHWRSIFLGTFKEDW